MSILQFDYIVANYLVPLLSKSSPIYNPSQKKADKNIQKTFANVDGCIDACFEEYAPSDYETLKIA